MRRLLISLAAMLTIALLCAAYVVWPLGTAFRIREAIRGGDAEYLAGKIEWSSVKRSLKPSLMHIALGPKPVAAPPAITAGAAARPGLWTRFKTYLGETAVDRMIEVYVTPEGLPKLFQYGKTYRETIKGEDDPATQPLAERIRRAWARVIRAEFTSLARFELEMHDRGEPPRTYTGVLELKGAEWKLTELTVKPATPTPAASPTPAANASAETATALE